jgi:hypothetical protein
MEALVELLALLVVFVALLIVLVVVVLISPGAAHNPTRSVGSQSYVRGPARAYWPSGFSGGHGSRNKAYVSYLLLFLPH